MYKCSDSIKEKEKLFWVYLEELIFGNILFDEEMEIIVNFIENVEVIFEVLDMEIEEYCVGVLLVDFYDCSL